MKANNADETIFIRRNKQLYAIIFYLSLVVSIGFTVFAEIIVKIMYGEAYLSSIAPLRIVTWYTAFSYLGVARNAWFVCKNKQKYLVSVYAVSAATNIVFNLILIPRFGASGAAVASLAAQIMTTMAVPFFIKEIKENSKIMIEAILLKGIKEQK